MMDSLQRRAVLVAGIYMAMHLAALWILPTYVWGVDLLRYGSAWGAVLFVVLGAVLLVPQGRSAILQVLSRVRRLRDWQLGLAIVIFGGMLMFAFPSATHLSGDGALYVRELDRGVYDAIVRTDRAPLAFWLIRNLHEWGRGVWHSAAWTFRIYSAVSGMIYLALIFPVARVLSSERVERAVLVGFLLSGGFLPLFFGYAETYAPVLPVVLVYVLVGARVLNRQGSLWLPAVIAGVAAALHVSQVMLWPSLIALAILRFGRSWRTVWRITDTVFVTLGVFVSLLLVLGISPDRVFMSGGTALLPVGFPAGFHQPYSMFNVLHLTDLLNVYLLAAPGAFLALWFFSRDQLMSPVAGFLGMAALFPALFTALANFEIGAFRDWDVQGLAALPLTVWAGWVFVHRVRDAHAGLLICGAAFLHTGIWVGVQAQVDASVTRFESLMKHSALSAHARSYGWETLAHFYRDHGDHDAMLRAYRNALKANPENPRQWALLGDMYFKLGRFSEAIVAFGEATTRKPDFFQAFMLKGDAHFHLKEYEKAIESFERVSTLRPEMLDVYYNLAQVYLALGNKYRAKQYVDLAEELEKRAP